MANTPNWKKDINLVGKCGSCKRYETFVKNGISTARGSCLLKNKYKQRTESCLKHE